MNEALKELISSTDPNQIRANVEQFAKAGSVEEVVAIAVQMGKQLTAEQVEAILAAIAKKSDEISLDELDNVAGGCENGDRSITCPRCGSQDTYLDRQSVVYDNVSIHDQVYIHCNSCGQETYIIG